MAAAYNWTANGYKISTLANVIVLIWTGAPSVDGVKTCTSAFTTLRREDPKSKVGLLSIIEQEAGHGTMDASVRNELSRMLKDNEKAIQAAAVVFEAQGFKATVVRSVVTAIQMASRVSFPSSVFQDRFAGAKWLVDHMPGSPASLAALTPLLRNTRLASSTATT